MNEVESRAASGLIRLPQSFVELNTAGEQSEGQMIHVLRRPLVSPLVAAAAAAMTQTTCTYGTYNDDDG